jgi:hypothetical protein
MKKSILSFVTTLLFAACLQAQTAPVPPDKVPQPDGTIQLVPKPPATVYVPYFIDPSIKYQLFLTSNWANKKWDGSRSNGQLAVKDGIVTADILAMPIYKTKVVNGKTVGMWSIYRSADVVIQYDHTRLQLLPQAGGTMQGFDPSVMDASKTTCTVLGDGLLLFHAEALKAPELRTPALRPNYYQWNFDGYMWSSAYRLLGKVQFKVKDDYYLPSWGAQKSFIRLLPSAGYVGGTATTKVDGSPVVGTNVLGEIRSQGEDIIFGVPPSYKVSHFLSAPSTGFKAGDTVKVQLKVKPDSKPQILVSLATNLVWDPSVLEMLGIDKTGGLPGMENAFGMASPGTINESSLPKDGNAWHNWLNVLSATPKYLEAEALICTFNFKVLRDFQSTNVEIVKESDPRLAGLTVFEESRPLGSSVPGSDILGSQRGTTINGILPN